MKRIFADYAYGNGPRTGCWWDQTCDVPFAAPCEGDLTVDVAVIGAGYTGLSAAITLARHGVSVAVLDAHQPGWGASGRNGGFCCLGGGKASDALLDKRYGKSQRLEFRRAEKDAVAHVKGIIERHSLDVDRHSCGETALAHRPKDMTALREDMASIRENYGVEPLVIERQDLAANGMQAGPFWGGLTIPIGFGLNPRKYLAGLVRIAQDAGVRLLGDSPVLGWARRSGQHRLRTLGGEVSAERVIVATNGYSSEDLPPWLSGRYMPAQSTVLVTRPISEEERAAQGWTTSQMCFDTRNLLHYFRLMPDGRFLFGMRGAVLTGPAAEDRARRQTRAHFERMFPAWRHIESVGSWSGFVSLARRRLPFVGPVPSCNGVWAAMCYHGNGVAMGSYAGHLIAEAVIDNDAQKVPTLMRQPLSRFPFGRLRRILMPPLYAGLHYNDTF